MYQNTPKSNRRGRRFTRIVASVPEATGLPTIWTWWSFSSAGRVLSCSATGICVEYAVPFDRVPETAPLGSIVADFTPSAETLFRNCVYVSFVAPLLPDGKK